MMNFCTLFDSNYIDKGIALYNSLSRVTQDFSLFVFCFDDITYQILNDMVFDHMILIQQKEFETQILLEKKSQRSKAEYCWTCTTSTIEYVLDNYDVNNCTYIDSDLFFYYDPKTLFDEIEESKAHIVITPHRFKNTIKNQVAIKRYGKYCVQFNYFDQSDDSRKALSWWKKQCLEWCYCKVENGRYGDQKYIDKFPDMFMGVHELQHLGGGVAPWNIEQYSLTDRKEDIIRLKENKSGTEFDLIFYHFHSLRFENEEVVNTCALTNDRTTILAIYVPYLREIIDIRKMLKTEYGIDFPVKVAHSNNPLKRVYQTKVRPVLFKNENNTINISDI